jgi:HEAT repeat protein
VRRALEEMNDERAISPLKTLLEDENGHIREEAKKAIEKN